MNCLYRDTCIDLNFIKTNYAEDVNINKFSSFKEFTNDIQFVDENTLQFIHPCENRDESEYDKKNPLNAYKTLANETLVSEIPNVVIDEENTILAPGEGEIPYSLTNDEYCEELSHPHLFPTGKFGYKVQRDIKLSPSKYCNQRLLNYSQKLSSNADYIFFAHQGIHVFE